MTNSGTIAPEGAIRIQWWHRLEHPPAHSSVLWRRLDDVAKERRIALHCPPESSPPCLDGGAVSVVAIAPKYHTQPRSTQPRRRPARHTDMRSAHSRSLRRPHARVPRPHAHPRSQWRWHAAARRTRHGRGARTQTRTVLRRGCLRRPQRSATGLATPDRRSSSASPGSSPPQALPSGATAILARPPEMFSHSVSSLFLR